MEQKTRIRDKIYHYLIDLFDTNTTFDVYELLCNSEIHIKDVDSIVGWTNNLHIIVDPKVFKKYQGLLEQFKNTIGDKFTLVTDIGINDVIFHPDLKKFKILNNTIIPIQTSWDVINTEQKHLIAQLRSATKSNDFQNIGNSARTLLQKLSNTIFIPGVHIAEDSKIDLSEGKFKNRLHTFIKCELEGRANKELRDFAKSVITTAEASVDLCNKLTHDLNATSLLAEASVISTITAISIINLIKNK